MQVRFVNQFNGPSIAQVDLAVPPTPGALVKTRNSLYAVQDVIYVIVGSNLNHVAVIVKAINPALLEPEKDTTGAVATPAPDEVGDTEPGDADEDQAPPPEAPQPDADQPRP